MHTSLAAQLAQLELGHLNIERLARTDACELPLPDAVDQTLAAIWSDYLPLLPALDGQISNLPPEKPMIRYRPHSDQFAP